MDNSENAKQLRETLRDIVKNLGIVEKNNEFCCGITYPQYCAIIEIGRAKEIVLKDLAEKLNLDKSTTSRTVTNLAKLDYVNIETAPTNRKFVQITLTEAGQKLFEGIEQGSEQYFTDILKLIPENKHSQILESIEYLHESISKLKCCAYSSCQQKQI